MTPDEADAFVAERSRGVVVTIRADGRPQLSNVLYALLGGRIRISVTDDRAKTRNLRRDPRVALHVASEDFWSYVVVEGEARLSPVATVPDDATAAALLRLYEAVRGEPHPDPAEFGRAMVDERRLELSFAVDRRYPTT